MTESAYSLWLDPSISHRKVLGILSRYNYVEGEPDEAYSRVYAIDSNGKLWQTNKLIRFSPSGFETKAKIVDETDATFLGHQHNDEYGWQDLCLIGAEELQKLVESLSDLCNDQMIIGLYQNCHTAYVMICMTDKAGRIKLRPPDTTSRCYHSSDSQHHFNLPSDLLLLMNPTSGEHVGMGRICTFCQHFIVTQPIDHSKSPP